VSVRTRLHRAAGTQDLRICGPKDAARGEPRPHWGRLDSIKVSTGAIREIIRCRKWRI